MSQKQFDPQEKSNLISFLIKAKRHTYAGHGAETTPCRPSSHDLQFSEDDLLYYDTFLGGQFFFWSGSTLEKQPAPLVNELLRPSYRFPFFWRFSKRSTLQCSCPRPFSRPRALFPRRLHLQLQMDRNF